MSNMKHLFKQMVFLTLLLTFPLLEIHAQITIHMKNKPASEVVKQIEKVSKYRFFYKKGLSGMATPITVDANNESIETVMAQMAKQIAVSYAIKGETQVVLAEPDLQNTAANSKKLIKGTITDTNGEPIVGANIVQKGTTNGVISDVNGNFNINIPAGAIIEVSYIGYLPKGIKIGEKTTISVILEENNQTLDEVVVVGYTTQKKTLLTGAISNMKMTDNLTTLPTTAVGNLLAGKMSGVNVGAMNGIPGSTPKISIRTESSWNEQTVTYIIDGVIRDVADFNNLSAIEIEDISVLKDAASAAIYGSRSAGGVIIVTTKKGNRGKPTFNYSYGYSIDTRTKNMDLTSGVETAELYNRMVGDDPSAWTKEEIDHIRTINGGYGYDNLETVWHNPATQTHNLSVSGGGDRVKYYAAASYMKQKGFLSPMSHDKYNIRMNVTADITKDFEVFTSFGLSDNKTGSMIYEGPSELYSKLRRWKPEEPMLTENGEYIDLGWTGNLVAFTTGAGGYNIGSQLKPQVLISGTYKAPFLKGLSAKVAYSQSWKHNTNKEFYHNYDQAMVKKDGANGRIVSTQDVIGTRKSSWVGKDYIQRVSKWGGDRQLNFQLNYENVFNKKHRVQVALVSEWYETNSTGVTAGRETFPVYLTDQFWAASDARADTWGNGDTDATTGRMSYIGQFNYSYADKYLLNFSFRQDGSMNFAPDQRWGFFPAGSVGWVISEEGFFNRSFVQFLKLRASFGLTGNDNVGGWQWQESYKGGNKVYYGTSPIPSVGITYGSVVNPNLTWEKALSYNVAADINFLNHWNASVDYWFRNSYDILGDRQNTLPTSFSLSMPAENYGQIHAQGIDVTVGYRGQSRDFSYFGNLTMSYGWNEVIKKDYAENAQWVDIPVGKSMNTLIGYDFDKIIRTQAELDDYMTANPGYNINGKKPNVGDMVYKDVTGPDGVPDGTIDSWDRVVLREKNYPIVYGLNLGGSWKGLSLDMMFSGLLGQKKNFRNVATAYEWQRMWGEWYDNAWTPENPDALLPRQVSSGQSSTYRDYDSNFWLQDHSFVRLKYLTLSYDLPKNMCYNKVFDNVRLFFTGTNLFVWSHFKYYDPELGAGNDFPVMRSFNFGIDVSF